MNLIRLRLGLFSEDIAQRFGISVSYHMGRFSEQGPEFVVSVSIT